MPLIHTADSNKSRFELIIVPRVPWERFVVPGRHHVNHATITFWAVQMQPVTKFVKRAFFAVEKDDAGYVALCGMETRGVFPRFA
jgi:hypothetical protein